MFMFIDLTLRFPFSSFVNSISKTSSIVTMPLPLISSVSNNSQSKFKIVFSYLISSRLSE